MARNGLSSLSRARKCLNTRMEETRRHEVCQVRLLWAADGLARRRGKAVVQHRSWDWPLTVLPLTTFKTSWLIAGPEGGSGEDFQKSHRSISVGLFLQAGVAVFWHQGFVWGRKMWCLFTFRFIGLEANSSRGKQSFQSRHYGLNGRFLQSTWQ